MSLVEKSFEQRRAIKTCGEHPAKVVVLDHPHNGYQATKDLFAVGNEVKGWG